MNSALIWRSAFIAAAVLCAPGPHAQIQPLVWRSDFTQPPSAWSTHGRADLFQWTAQGLRTTWDSAQPNSFFYLPLGVTLTPEDDFEVILEFSFNQLQPGSTPGKSQTFQLALGLINIRDATAPTLRRGSGINTAHGPRNLLEFNYFPEAGVIAPTVAPTIATASNQIAFSGNHPLELSLAVQYRLQMKWTGADRTLRSTLLADGAPFGMPPNNALRDLVLGPEYSTFQLDALAVMSYSDEGQSPPQFAGSIYAEGVVRHLQVTLWNRPRLTIKQVGQPELAWPTEQGWTYTLQTSTDLLTWNSEGPPQAGTGEALRVIPPQNADRQFYRVQARRVTQP